MEQTFPPHRGEEAESGEDQGPNFPSRVGPSGRTPTTRPNHPKGQLPPSYARD